MDEEALPMEGIDAEDIKAGGISWTGCRSCFICIGAVENIGGFSKYE